MDAKKLIACKYTYANNATGFVGRPSRNAGSSIFYPLEMLWHGFHGSKGPRFCLPCVHVGESGRRGENALRCRRERAQTIGKKHELVRQDRRPTECVRCCHNRGIHALHSLLDRTYTHPPSSWPTKTPTHAPSTHHLMRLYVNSLHTSLPPDLLEEVPTIENTSVQEHQSALRTMIPVPTYHLQIYPKCQFSTFLLSQPSL